MKNNIFENSPKYAHTRALYIHIPIAGTLRTRTSR